MADKIYVNWDEFHKHAKELAEKIKAYRSFDKIVAVSRGGLLPAGIIAYNLGIRNVQTINMSSYDDDVQRSDNEVEISADIGSVDENTIIIDDLADTGKTFQLLHRIYPKAVMAAVYAKPQGSVFLDIYARDIPDKWIVFPWD